MGGLGVMASHCIVQAQLVVPHNGVVKHHGPHLFIMRSEPLPSIVLPDREPSLRSR